MRKKWKNFSVANAPYVKKKLALSVMARKRGDKENEFKLLEDAHVLGQQSTPFHTIVHWQMLKYGLRYRSLKEVTGQIFRLIGAVTKTPFGILPKGNTGGANVNAFESMPISTENKTILAKVTRI